MNGPEGTEVLLWLTLLWFVTSGRGQVIVADVNGRYRRRLSFSNHFFDSQNEAQHSLDFL